MELGLVNDDLSQNKNPRLPICIAVETTDSIVGNAINLEVLKKGLAALCDHILNSLSLRSTVELCVFYYGDDAKKVRDYKPLSNDEPIKLEKMSGKTGNLDKVIQEMIKTYRIRKNDYDLHRIQRYRPVFMIIGSGREACPESKAIDQLCHWEKVKQATVLPVKIGDAKGDQLKSLTFEKVEYQMDLINVESMFESFGKSIEKLSESTVNAVINLKEHLTSWDEYKRK